MDLLGGYGSDSGSDGEGQPVNLQRLPVVSAAPHSVDAPDALPRQPATKATTAPAAAKPRLVVGSAFGAAQDADGEGVVGPAPPPRAPVADEAEIPGSSTQDQVWSQLPAPKSQQRRVVALHLPLNKALLLAGKADLLTRGLQDEEEEEAERARAKRLKGGAGSGNAGGLMGFLPPPKHAGRIDLGFDVNAARRAGPSSDSGAATAAEGSRPTGGSMSMPGSGPSAGSTVVGLSNEAFRVRHADSDEDEDPMARLGPMPDAGAFAAGPAADEGEEVEVGVGPKRGPSGEEEPAAGPSRPAQLWGAAQQYAPQAVQYHAQHYAQQYDAQQYQVDDGAGYYQGAAQGEQYGGALPETGDAGQDLLAQALVAEQQRAARKGKGVDLGSIQFKEVSGQQLRHMDPAARAEADSVRQALGSEYAVKMRTEAKSHEGSKMAKRKHQIGTLFFNAKMKELEILEGKAHQMRTKSETQAKYGW